MNTTPRRPRLTKEQIAEAVKNNLDELPFTAKQFADEYEGCLDSYELAKKLDDNCGCSLSRNDLDAIEELQAIVEDAQKQLVEKWFEENDIQPPYPIGTRITKGVIDGIYEYIPAYYTVQEDDETDPTRRLLIRFEDAQTAQ